MDTKLLKLHINKKINNQIQVYRCLKSTEKLFLCNL